MAGFQRKSRGFQTASTLLQSRIKSASETRGFAVTRLLTHWSEVVGEKTASTCTPVKISYGKGGFGATLTVLTTGAQAPMLQAELPKLTDRVNQVYGYRAISRIRITQTAPTGFAEGQAVFSHAPTPKPEPDAASVEQAKGAVDAVTNPDLKAALEALGANVISKSRDRKRPLK